MAFRVLNAASDKIVVVEKEALLRSVEWGVPDALSNVPEYLVDFGNQVELRTHPANFAAVHVSIAFEQFQHVALVARSARVELQGDEMRYIDHGQMVARNVRGRGLD